MTKLQGIHSDYVKVKLDHPQTKRPTNTRAGGARPGAGRPKSASPSVVIGVRLDADTLARLDALATNRKISRSAIIAEAIRMAFIEC